MAFRAVHAQWGTVFAHLPDLGCGQSWEAVWRARPRAPLTCDECRHPMHGKTRGSTRFFAHDPNAPDCTLARDESLPHHLLKLELANAARDAGAFAELEVRGPDGRWRADVLASASDGSWRMALEAQLSPITLAEITARTRRMRADGVPSIWFSDRPRPPWLGTVPSVRLSKSEDGGLVVTKGLMNFGRYWRPVPATLTGFLGQAFTGCIVPHKQRVSLDRRTLVWATPSSIQAEDRYLARLHEQLRRETERKRRIEEEAWLTMMSKAVADATDLETCRTLWRETAEKYHSGVTKALLLRSQIEARAEALRAEALEDVPQVTAEPAEAAAAPAEAAAPIALVPRPGPARARLSVWHRIRQACRRVAA